MSNRLLQNLNDAQREAVTTTEGPLLVIAGAGSGKTRVLTRRYANILLSRLAEPRELLAVTFTNKAAGEMKERVSSLMGGPLPGMMVSTFHSFCARFLRAEASSLGYDSSYSVFDSDDSKTLVKNCIKDLGLSTTQFVPRAQLRKISSAKNKMISAEAFASSASGYFEEATAKIYTLYQARLQDCNSMDFDDLLFNSVRLLKSDEEIGQRYRNRFRYIMVDEYQDTNHVQYLLLKNLIGDHHNLCVVGDEDQSIYGWRGADIRNILDFEKDYPGAKVIKLEENYRSTDVILKAASAVIANNMSRKDKTLRTSRTGGEKIRLILIDSAEDEAVRVIDSIVEKRASSPLNEMVILYRTNAQSRAFEEHLRRRNLPYQIFGGISFYQRKEIKDLMAYLKLIVNPKDDVSFLRTVNFPKRGLGEKTLSEIGNLARIHSLSMYEVALNSQLYPTISNRAGRLKSFTDIIEKYIAQRDTLPSDLLTADLIDDVKLLEEYQNEDEITGQTRIENIEAFIEGVAEYARTNSDGTLAEYLADISLFTDLDTYEDSDDKLTLMTIHSAKGLEYDHVFIVGLEEGLLPMGRAVNDPMELEEERRLFYVGSTRARKSLVLSSATTRHRFGEVQSIPSRFIKEIPSDVIERLDFRKRRHYEFTQQTKAPSFFDKRHSTPAVKDVHYEFEDDEIYRAGRIVQHPTFGRGKVMATEGYGDSLTIQINFSGVGVKKIMARYAKLKVIG